MKIFLTILISLFTLSVAFGGENDYKVSGLVFGAKDKKPKSEVFIVAYKVKRDAGTGKALKYQAESEKSYTFSDEDGRFSLELSGKFEYMIEFVREGYLLESFLMDKKPGIAEGEHIKVEIPIRKGSSILLSETYVDEDSGEPVPDLEVKMLNMADSVIKTFRTNQDGKYYFTVGREGEYILSSQNNIYFHSGFDTLTIRIKNFEDYNRRIPVQKINIGYKRNIGDLTYSINSVELSEQGEQILETVVSLLKYNSQISIELACHTDSRGDDDYNLELTQKRAERIVKYLSDFGIQSVRIKPKGYGETKLLNECSNGVFCDTEKHAENRRVEFQIIATKQ